MAGECEWPAWKDDGMEWSDNFLTGVGPIDRQHMNILEMAEAFHESIRRGGGESRGRLLSLIAYLETHTGEEEALMKSSRHPRYRSHKRSHAALLTNIRSLHSYIESNSLNPYTGEFIISETAKWLTEHMRYTDRNIGLLQIQRETGSCIAKIEMV